MKKTNQLILIFSERWWVKKSEFGILDCMWMSRSVSTISSRAGISLDFLETYLSINHFCCVIQNKEHKLSCGNFYLNKLRCLLPIAIAASAVQGSFKSWCCRESLRATSGDFSYSWWKMKLRGPIYELSLLDLSKSIHLVFGRTLWFPIRPKARFRAVRSRSSLENGWSMPVVSNSCLGLLAGQPEITKKKMTIHYVN